MPDVWLALTVGAAAGVAAGLFLMTRRRQDDVPAAFADEREERLARRLARVVGCTPDQAVLSVRREVGIAPDQTDETLLKRAAYHYRQELPEKACPVYRERARG